MNSLKDITKLRLSETFHGDTQEVTAKKLNTTQGNVSKWVNGQQIPTPEMLHDISKVYKVSVDWLLGISEEREIDGIALERLTYEQVARIIDKLIEMGTIIIPDLQKLREDNPDKDTYISPEDEEEPPPKDPIFDSDYMKVKDRVLSHMLRRRLKIYEIGEDMKDAWKKQSLERYRGLWLLNYTGNMEDAIDTQSWARFNDGDWVELIRRLEKMTEEERTILIEESKLKEKDGINNG